MHVYMRLTRRKGLFGVVVRDFRKLSDHDLRHRLMKTKTRLGR